MPPSSQYQHTAQQLLVRKEKIQFRFMIGILFTIFFLVLFFSILQDYRTYDPLVRADTRIVNLIYTFRSETLNNVMLLVTNLATLHIVFIGLAVIGFLLFALNLLPYFYALVLSAAGGEMIYWVIKNLIQRPRPPSINALILAHGFSFPSGHTFVAFSFYGLLAYIVYRTSTKKIWKIGAITGGMTIIGVIGLSRVYLGVHWPSDIFASFALGAAWLTLLITILELHKKTSWIKENIKLIGKKFVMVPTMILFLFWFAYIGYFFQTNSFTPQIARAQNLSYIREADMPNNLFMTLPRSSETLSGLSMNPINIVIVGNYYELVDAFTSAGWIQPEPLTPAAGLRNIIASILNEPYPQAIEAPAFWNSRPNDFAFQLPTATIRQRHHIHFWTTPLLTDRGHHVWFATAHFDKDIKLKTIMPTHTIDPYVDNEREMIKQDIVKTGQVNVVEKFQIVPSSKGKNFAGDIFITDGYAYILFLKDDLMSSL